MNSNLAERLRAARAFSNKSQADIAKACGLTRPAVSQWEKLQADGRTQPDLAQLRLISKLTGVPLDFLIDDNAHAEDVWNLGKRKPQAVPEAPPPARNDFIAGVRFQLSLLRPALAAHVASGAVDFLTPTQAVQFVVPGDSLDWAVSRLLAVTGGQARTLAIFGPVTPALEALRSVFNLQVVAIHSLDEAVALLT